LHRATLHPPPTNRGRISNFIKWELNCGAAAISPWMVEESFRPAEPKAASSSVFPGQYPGQNIPVNFRAPAQGNAGRPRLMGQMLNAMDDSDLAAAALSGDREAFRCLLERHYDMIYRVARRYVGSAADAEDIAQDVCVTLATRLANFRNRSRFSTWLISIVINRCRDVHRRRKSSEKLVERYVALREAEDADQADTDTRSAWLHATLQRLEPSLRETALLILGEDLSHKEAAMILGCAESTVSWRMHMARKELSARMDDDDE
jgi:RNA polymerase sigma-70 factor, ECF subfamily